MEWSSSLCPDLNLPVEFFLCAGPDPYKFNSHSTSRSSAMAPPNHTHDGNFNTLLYRKFKVQFYDGVGRKCSRGFNEHTFSRNIFDGACLSKAGWGTGSFSELGSQASREAPISSSNLALMHVETPFLEGGKYTTKPFAGQEEF